MNVFSSYEQKGRINSIDLMKLFASFLVILSHCVMRYVSPIPNNFIWLTQMPLFMFASGFLNINSGRVSTFKGYAYREVKNALVLLIPCLSFLFITCAIDGKNVGTSLIDFYKDPQTNLWFLWVLFAMHIIFDFGLYLSNKFKSKFKVFTPVIISIAFSILIIALMFIVKDRFDFNILSLKLIAFYFIFYCLGYLFHLLVNTGIFKNNKVQIVTYVIVALAFGLLLFECLFFDCIYAFDDSSIKYQFIRIMGCIASVIVFTFLFDLAVRCSFISKLSKFGAYSLQSYYLHLIFLRFLTYSSDVYSIQCVISISTAMLLVAMIAATLIVIYFIPYLHFVLFGKSFSCYSFEKRLPKVFR